MVQDPHAFWERQRAYSFPGLSWNSIVTKFTVMVTDPAVIRHVFQHNSKDTLLLDLHPNAKMILGTRNIAFMHGPEHKVGPVLVDKKLSSTDFFSMHCFAPRPVVEGHVVH